MQKNDGPEKKIASFKSSAQKKNSRNNQLKMDKESHQRSEKKTTLAESAPFSTPFSIQESAPLIGVTVSKTFQIESVLGQGGFGTVYRARDISLERIVALKFLRGPLDSQRQELFEREAKAIAKLSRHKGIVEIYHWGEHQGNNYFALEYIDSGMKQLMDEYPDGLPVHLALQIILQCAEALQEAHENNILHRDIKPANVLLDSKTNEVKLTDFGLAKITENSGQFTLDGSVSGTPAYMSPEQAKGESLDARSDVYSLGVTLYELLSKRRPFEAESGREAIQLIIRNERASFTTRRPDLPQSICNLVETATAYKAADRFQTAAEFAREIRSIATALERTGQAPTVSLSSRPKRSKSLLFPRSKAFRALAAVVLAACFFIALLSTYYGGRSTLFGPNMVLAKAKENMDQGAYANAQTFYEEYLAEDPDHAEASFGLFLAHLHLGALDEARELSIGIRDDALQAQAMASIAIKDKGAAARDELDKAKALKESRYLDMLYARLDAMTENSQAVVDRLQDLKQEDFPFYCEYATAVQLLGQAQYRLGANEEAKALFALLEDSPIPQRARVAHRYLASIDRRMSTAQREEVRAAAQRIHALIKEGSPLPEGELDWSSRPLTFFILPMQATQGGLAAQMGLVDLLPYELGNALDLNSPMNVLDRSLLEEVLAEQELATLIGSKSGQLTLGRVLGARLILQCEASYFGGKERIAVRIDDVESTERIPLKSLDLKPQLHADALLQSMTEAIWEAVGKAYPLQGRVWTGPEGIETNLGAQVGLEAGMAFDLLIDADAGPLPSITLSVQKLRAPMRALLSIEGMDKADLPNSIYSAWYIQQRFSPPNS